MRDTIDMAREAGLIEYGEGFWFPIGGLSAVKAFEALVRADEREACAKVCEEVERKSIKQPPMVGQGCQACAVAIRARGNQ
jgi:hypothetical protein